MLPTPTHRALFAVVTVAAVLAGCDDTPSTAPQHAAPASLAVAAGTAQTGGAGLALGTPLSVLVTDGNGHPVPGVAVAWNVTGAGGLLLNAQVASDSTGHATATWVLGTGLGVDSVTASVSDGNTLINAIFTANAVAGPVAKIVIVSGDAQSAAAGSALPAPIVVQVTDAYGNPVAGATVTWAAATGTLAAVTSVTDANGRATNALTLGGTAGADPVTVTATGTSGPVATIIPETAN
jgi:hypothetical protein